MPFLRFRLDQVFRRGSLSSPEGKAKLAEAALQVVREHPDDNVQRLYVGEIAAQTGLPAAELLKALSRHGPVLVEPLPKRPSRESAEAVALALLVHRWDDIAPWLVEALFADEQHLATFRALADAHGDAHAEQHQRLAQDHPDDVAALRDKLRSLPYRSGRPSALVCHTVKGKGVPEAENNADWHHKNKLTAAELGSIRAVLGEA